MDITSPSIRAFGAWLEQLLAESTGKKGVGFIPVNGEIVGTPEVYGEDRMFVYLRDERGRKEGQDVAVKQLEKWFW